jgi:HEAT repeat protein
VGALAPAGRALDFGADEQVGSAGSDLAGEVVRILESSEPAPIKGSALADLGREALPFLFEQYALGAGRRAPSEDDPLVIAFRGLGRSAVVPLVVAEARSDQLATRVAAVEVLGMVGRRSELELVVEAAGPRSADEAVEVALVRACQWSAREILEADSAALMEVRWLVGSSPTELGAALVRATADVGAPECLPTLLDVLGKEPDLDAVVLAHLGRSARFSYRPPAESQVAVVLPYLDSANPNEVRAALQAVGDFELQAAAEACADLLESESQGVRDAAHLALKRISCLAMPPDAARWRGWCQAERAWLRDEAPRAYDLLERGAPRSRIAALKQIARHRLERHALAERVAGALSSDVVDVRREACATLAQLQSRAALPYLVAALSDEDVDTAHCAWRTLTDWTGLDLPLGSPEWQQLLEGSAASE